MNEYVELKGGRMLEAPVTGGTGNLYIVYCIVHIEYCILRLYEYRYVLFTGQCETIQLVKTYRKWASAKKIKNRSQTSKQKMKTLGL